MRNRVYNALLNKPILQKVQAPALVTLWGCAAGERDQVRFGLCIEDALLAVLLRLVFESRFLSLLAEAATDAANGERAGV